MSLKENLKSLIQKNKFFYNFIRQLYIYSRNINLKYFSGSNKDIFTHIYKNNKWGDKYSFSGSGSNLNQTKIILENLPRIINKYEIKSILDLPCGDFYWMKEYNFQDLKYIGADIVPELINKNISKFSQSNINFKIIDLINNELPYSDLLFCRDCLVHFSFEDIIKALINVKKTKFKYFMTTNFVRRESNVNIVTGSWRTLNLCKGPFNFPKPTEIIFENCTESDNQFLDKVLSMWEVELIPDFN